jgi:hypothetical protein
MKKLLALLFITSQALAAPGNLVGSNAFPNNPQNFTPVPLVSPSPQPVPSPSASVVSNPYNNFPTVYLKPAQQVAQPGSNRRIISVQSPDKTLTGNGTPATLQPDHFSIMADYGSFTNLTSKGVEAEYRSQYWGLGLYYDRINTKPNNTVEQLDGEQYGLDVHYYFLPYWYTESKNVVSSSLFLRMGVANLNSDQDGKLILPEASVGAEFSYLLVSHVSVYSKIGLDYIYRSNSMNFLGSELNVGLKLSF